VTIVTDPYGPTQEAGGPAEVAGTRVSDVVIATNGQLRGHGYRAGGCATHHTVGTVGLVCHAGLSARTHDVGARLFALSLVHDF